MVYNFAELYNFRNISGEISKCILNSSNDKESKDSYAISYILKDAWICLKYLVKNRAHLNIFVCIMDQI